MRRFVPLATNLLLLALCVPWLAESDTPHAGLPAWAWYALGATVVYALATAYSLNRHWDSSAECEEDDA